MQRGKGLFHAVRGQIMTAQVLFRIAILGAGRQTDLRLKIDGNQKRKSIPKHPGRPDAQVAANRGFYIFAGYCNRLQTILVATA